MTTLEVTEANISTAIQANGITILDFWAPWCGPCRNFAPVFDQAAKQHADITFGKINTDAEQALAGAFNIRSIPTLMVFRDQIMVYRDAGALPAAAFEDLIRQVRALDMDQVRAEVEAQKTH